MGPLTTSQSAVLWRTATAAVMASKGVFWDPREDHVSQGMDTGKLTPPMHVAVQGHRSGHKTRTASPRSFSRIRRRPSPW